MENVKTKADMTRFSRHLRRPYAVLAAAILKHGILENDQRFLQSDWAQSLRELAGSCDYNPAQDAPANKRN